MPIYSSSNSEESNNDNSLNVADIILWRNESLSVANILGFMTIWFLLEVLEYTSVSVVFYVVILCILMIFITMIVMLALLSFYGTSTEVTNWGKISMILHYCILEKCLKLFFVIGLALLTTSVIANYLISPLYLLFIYVICLGLYWYFTRSRRSII
ncbi:reticulon-like protein B14 isoform X1 [Helianthus annuus]|uniref:reticulon-like protein B14 isoform X1 n=1 Tax=Helianthus annuus TaxID=4232 RepID=UPI000B8F56D9|nr:reticulon-like protein B14 isoform X1 [Helianthus annuus]